MTQLPTPAPILLPLPYLADSMMYFHTIAAQLPMALILQSDITANQSPESRSSLGRFDILTAAPEYWLQTSNGQVSFCGDYPPSLSLAGNSSFEALHSLLEMIQNTRINYLQCIEQALPFCGGLIGYCSYDLAREYIALSNIANKDIDIPDMQFGFYGWACIQDHLDQKSWLVIHPNCNPSIAEKLPAIIGNQQNNAKTNNTLKPVNFSRDITVEQYINNFEQIIKYIRAGDCYQVNLAQRFQSKTLQKSVSLYADLRAAMPSPFCAYFPILGLDIDTAIISLSPERFLQVDIDKNVISQPIKGTSERFADQVRDSASSFELQTSEKCKSENLMIVDLLRNDMGRVCEVGSIHVSKIFELQSFSNVHHLVSTIEGRLKSGLNGANLLAACFPGGSITGAPKIRAMEIIEELESTRRSIYCGSMVVFSAHGTMDSNIMIRTLLLQNGNIHCWAGGGIVADSDGLSEYEESLSKISILMNNIR